MNEENFNKLIEENKMLKSDNLLLVGKIKKINKDHQKIIEEKDKIIKEREERIRQLEGKQLNIFGE